MVDLKTRISEVQKLKIILFFVCVLFVGLIFSSGVMVGIDSVPTPAVIVDKDTVYREFIPEKYLPMVDRIHNELDFSYKIIYRLVDTESKWNPNALGKNANGTFDRGLCQLNSGNAWGDVSDPNDNLWAGFKYLSVLRYDLKTIEGALLAYNCGPGRFASGKIPESTIKYAERILK